MVARPSPPPGPTNDSTHHPATEGRSGQATEKSRFRPDIEGLRGVAVLAVVLYHAAVPFVSGGYVGVDVFFVISGFLITQLIMRELATTGTVSLPRFYARRIRRLLPLAVTVLGVTAVGSRLLISPVRHAPIAHDIAAAGLYIVNWPLAAHGVDYSEAGLDTSPVQHFWSLAVEEQYYIVWPGLLLLVAWWWRRRRNSDVRPAVTVLAAAGTAASLLYCIWITHAVASFGYFSTLARAWELLLGGLLALLPVARLRMPRGRATVLGIAGLALIGLAVFGYDHTTSFPGSAALVPTLGAVLLIASGTAQPDTVGSRLLGAAPLRHVGGISYAWYLWHWPVFILAQAHWGDLSVWRSAACLATSYLLALASHYWIEQPLRHASPLARSTRRSLSFGGVCMVACLMVAFGLQETSPTLRKAPPERVTGAETQHKKPQHRADELRPEPKKADDDRGQMHEDGCLVGLRKTTSPSCVYGDPSSVTEVVLFGDSHMMHYFPALNTVAREHGWRLVGLTKSGCSPAKTHEYSSILSREYSECDTWRNKAIKRIVKAKPDLIITGSLTTYRTIADGKRLGREASDAALIDGYVTTLDRLRRTGAQLRVMHDTPRPDEDIPSCVAQHKHNLDTCSFGKSKAFDYTPIGTRAAARAGVGVLDATDKLCPRGRCPAVIGNALVYRNAGHLTATYAATLAPWFARRLNPLLT